MIRGVDPPGFVYQRAFGSGLDGCLDVLVLGEERLNPSNFKFFVYRGSHPAGNQHLAVLDRGEHIAVVVLVTLAAAVLMVGAMIGFGAGFEQAGLTVFNVENSEEGGAAKVGADGGLIFGNDGNTHGNLTFYSELTFEYPGEDVVIGEDQVFAAVEFDLCAAVLGKQNFIANVEI